MVEYKKLIKRMQNSDSKNSQGAYDAAQDQLCLGDFGVVAGIDPADPLVTALWDRMSAPDDGGATPIDAMRKASTNIRAVMDPMIYRVAWDRIAAELEAIHGITRGTGEKELRRILDTPAGRTLVPSGYLNSRDKSKYTLYQWVVRYRVRQFMNTNTGVPTMTPDGQAVFRESLIRVAPHLTVYHPQDNLTWINDPSRKDVRDRLRELMGDGEIPDDSGTSGQIENTPEMIALLAHLKKMPNVLTPTGAAAGATTHFETVYNEALGADVAKAEKRLAAVKALFDPLKAFRDTEKQTFDRGLADRARSLSEREASLSRYQSAADAITEIVTAEEDRFNKKAQLSPFAGRITAKETEITTLQAAITATPSPAAPTIPAPTPIVAPPVAPSPGPDPRVRLRDEARTELMTLEAARTTAHNTREATKAKLNRSITATKGAITRGQSERKDATWVQERRDRIQQMEGQIAQLERDEASEVSVFERRKDTLTDTVGRLDRDIATSPMAPAVAAPSPSVIVVSPPAMPAMPLTPLADPRTTHLTTLQGQLEGLQHEQARMQTEFDAATTRSRSLRTRFTTSFASQINDADPAIRGLFNKVTASPLNIDTITDRTAWDAAIRDLTDAPSALMANHATRKTAYDTDKRAFDRAKPDEESNFTDRFDKNRAFSDYAAGDLPATITKDALEAAHFANFKQLEDEFTAATEAVRLAKTARAARGADANKNLSPIEVLRLLNENDSAIRGRLGGPQERPFRAMVATLLEVNMARNRAVYAQRIRRLAEQATTPRGLSAWVKDQITILAGKAPRKFDDYRLDHLLTDPKFKKLDGLRLNTGIDEIAGWVGEGDGAVLTLGTLQELIEKHIRPLAMDAKSGARLTLEESAKIVELLGRLEAVYYTALVRKKMSATDAPKNKAELFGSMLDSQLTPDVPRDSGRFMTAAEAQADRPKRKPPKDETGSSSTDLITQLSSGFSAEKLLRFGVNFLIGWLGKNSGKKAGSGKKKK